VIETLSKKGYTMLVNWKKDLDAALAEAKTQNKPLLIDFSAAPA
jgi:thiamine pyrophosphate-dependent acetolactate synthase large subunit-like protein